MDKVRETLDIVSMMTTNPILKLDSDSNSRLITKIQEKFKGEDKNIFLSSLYCFLNYHKTDDFVIDLDEIWSWLGFDRKGNAKRTLENNFKKDTDFIVEKAASQRGEAGFQGKNLGGSGLNKEKILMNIQTFKKLCLRAKTKKAEKIHDYFLTLEEMVYELLEEQVEKLNTVIKVKDSELQQVKQIVDRYNNVEFEFDLNNWKKGIRTLYLIRFGKDCYKIGITTNLPRRLTNHESNFNMNFKSGDNIIKCWNTYNREVSREVEQKIINYVRYKGYEITWKGQERELMKTGGVGSIVKLVDIYLLDELEKFSINMKNTLITIDDNVRKFKMMKKTEEEIKLIEELDKVIKCNSCNTFIEKNDEKNINSRTGNLYKRCVVCRKNDRVTSEDFSDANSYMDSDSESEYEGIEIEVEIITCCYCSKEEEAEINSRTKEHYKSCKECREKKYKKRFKKKNEPKSKDMCTYGDCRNILDKTLINKSNGTYYRRCVSCREILKEKDRKRYSEQKEKRLQSKKKQYENNKERILDRNREYYYKNSTEIIERKRQLKNEKNGT